MRRVNSLWQNFNAGFESCKAGGSSLKGVSTSVSTKADDLTSQGVLTNVSASVSKGVSTITPPPPHSQVA